MDFSERGEHFAAPVAGHGQDRGHVFDDQHAVVAETAQ